MLCAMQYHATVHCCSLAQEHNEALRKALEVKKAELAAAVAAAQHSSSPPETSPLDDSLADKVSAMEKRARSLAEQLHYKVCTLATPTSTARPLHLQQCLLAVLL